MDESAHTKQLDESSLTKDRALIEFSPEPLTLASSQKRHSANHQSEASLIKLDWLSVFH